jgi:hypothetical protein
MPKNFRFWAPMCYDRAEIAAFSSVGVGSMTKPALKTVPSDGVSAPPRPLGRHGTELWRSIMNEYEIADRGGTELLAEACVMLDRAEELAAAIGRDGVVIYGKSGPREHPAVKGELGARSFVVRTLGRLGLDVEAIKSVGRPPPGNHWNPIA